MIYPFRIYSALFFILLTISAFQLPGQDNSSSQDPLVIDLNEIENDGKRVEVQRYIGYENLLFRYLTLPYDISLNSSNQGRYFDIGFALFSILPVALLILVYNSKRKFYVLLSIIILYLCLSLSFSLIKFDKRGAVMSSDEQWTAVTDQIDKNTSETILLSIYNVAKSISFPVRSIVNKLSKESDYITYPLLFLLFAGLLIFAMSEFRHNLKALFMTLVVIVYFFLWLLLSGGIIWYGFLLIPLLFTLAFKSLHHFQKDRFGPNKIVRSWILITLCFWMILAYAARIGNIDYFTESEHMGKGIVDSKLIYYSAGLHTLKEAQNFVYSNIGNTFEEINNNDGLIYQVGTSITFNIRNNPDRIFQDNILITFFEILNKYRDPNTIIDVLKASGFKYIIIDLYTPTLDKTPEKSLTKKYQLLLNTLYQSRDIELLATDRIIEVTRENRQTEIINNVFVTDYNSKDNVKIQNHGSYAIYEIH